MYNAYFAIFSNKNLVYTFPNKLGKEQEHFIVRKVCTFFFNFIVLYDTISHISNSLTVLTAISVKLTVALTTLENGTLNIESICKLNFRLQLSTNRRNN